MIEVRREDLTSTAAQALIAALNADLRARYPGDGSHYFRLDADEVRPGRGAFVVAYAADNTPVGCGAVRLIDPGVAEIKRMYVLPGLRGRGIARRILEVLESAARSLGVTTLMLETGTRQPEAIALYEKTGFSPRGPFGDYPPSPLNVFFEKRL